MKNVTLGQLIREQREALGLTQDDLSKLTEISQQSIAKYENGQSAPRPGNIKRLAQHLKLDPLDLAKAKTGSNSPIQKLNDARNKIVDQVIKSSEIGSKNELVGEMQKQQQLVTQLKREIQDILEIKYSEGKHQTKINVGRRSYEISYLSDSVAAQFVFLTNYDQKYLTRLTSAAWRLSVIMAGLGQQYKGVPWLIGVMPEFEAPENDDDDFPTSMWLDESIQQFRNEASILGIQTDIFATPVEVADLIYGLERQAKHKEAIEDFSKE